MTATLHIKRDGNANEVTGSPRTQTFIAPTTAVGPQSGTITITANDPLPGTFTVPVTGTGN